MTNINGNGAAANGGPTLVTGGTGTLGRLVVSRLQDSGRAVRVLTRSSREPSDGIEFVSGDLATGEGVDSATAGAETIFHLAGSSKGDEVKAANLVRAAKRAGTEHLVYIGSRRRPNSGHKRA